MKIDILSLFPEMYDGFLETSIIKRARKDGIVEIAIHNFREFALDRHKSVDDTPYGGGQGMLLKPQPLIDCLKSLDLDDATILLMSPQGQRYDQKHAERLAKEDHLVIICGHYEGFDERIRDYVDEEISIGDYVLTGGELASMVITDSVTRLLEGTIRQSSHEDDSFSSGLLEYPQYTHPYEYDGSKVPDVLLSGHHEKIRQWRLRESLRRTLLKRPDLLADRELTEEEAEILEELKKTIEI